VKGGEEIPAGQFWPSQNERKALDGYLEFPRFRRHMKIENLMSKECPGLRKSRGPTGSDYGDKVSVLH